MRYIKKTTEPACMTTWKELRKTAEQPLAYDDFDKKKELNEYLRTEQHHICCYCLQQAMRIFPSESDVKSDKHFS